MVIPYSEENKALAHEILMAAAKGYTEDQLREIPAIMNCKSRYFWGNDFNDYEVLRDVFTEEGFRTYWNGYAGAADASAQIDSIKTSIGAGDMVPMHFGHNQVVQFLDETHARMLTRMNDHHVYLDNEEEYLGYGFYIDDLRKCTDGVWRIEVLRLNYCVINGSLRSMRGE